MFVLQALSECLAFIRRFQLATDKDQLQQRIALPAHDPDSWDAILSAAPSAVVLRSSILSAAAWSLTDDFGHWYRSGGYGFGELLRARRQYVDAISNHDWTAAAHEIARPGALLVFDPAKSLFDGAGQVASNGYLDRNYVPPWDTWLMTLPPEPQLGTGVLVVCWVPEWATDFAAGGMAVDAAACLSWAAIRGDDVHVLGWGKDSI